MFDKPNFYEFQNEALSIYIKLLRLFFVGMPVVYKEFMINYYFLKNIGDYIKPKNRKD